ncbi:MAG TPA: Na+/H+ antiporter subunit D, partial [Flavobacteriaceae bacterium]|nr:Na+/H+ antiporter subunit D [Flavobacteriaceae bacterium]
MEQLVIYPLLLQLLPSIVLMYFWNKVKVQKVISVAGSFFALVIAIVLFTQIWNEGTQTVQSGNWEAPFG